MNMRTWSLLKSSLLLTLLGATTFALSSSHKSDPLLDFALKRSLGGLDQSLDAFRNLKTLLNHQAPRSDDELLRMSGLIKDIRIIWDRDLFPMAIGIPGAESLVLGGTASQHLAEIQTSLWDYWPNKHDASKTVSSLSLLAEDWERLQHQWQLLEAGLGLGLRQIHLRCRDTWMEAIQNLDCLKITGEFLVILKMNPITASCRQAAEQLELSAPE